MALAELTPERQYEQYIASFRSVVGWTQKVLNSLQAMQWLQIGFDSKSGAGGGGAMGRGDSVGEGLSSMAGSPGESVDFVPSIGGADLAVPVVNPVAPKLYHMTNPNERIKDIVEL